MHAGLGLSRQTLTIIMNAGLEGCGPTNVLWCTPCPATTEMASPNILYKVKALEINKWTATYSTRHYRYLFTTCHANQSWAFGLKYRTRLAKVGFFFDVWDWNFDQFWNNTDPKYPLEWSLVSWMNWRLGTNVKISSFLSDFDLRVLWNIMVCCFQWLWHDR